VVLRVLFAIKGEVPLPVLPGAEAVLEHDEGFAHVEGSLPADAGADALCRAHERLGRPGVLDPLLLRVASSCPSSKQDVLSSIPTRG
jgi:hypothetical protein